MDQTPDEIAAAMLVKLTSGTSCSSDPKKSMTQGMQRFGLARTLSWLKLDVMPGSEWKDAAAMAILFLNRWWANDRTKLRFVLIGPTGSGKSAIAKGMANVTSVHNVDAWRDGLKWSRPPETSMHAWSQILTSSGDVFDDSCKSDFAVIDDIGSEVDKYKSQEGTEKLRLLLEARENKFTVITTNVPEADWITRWDDRVESRLHHKALVVTLNSKLDLRKTL